MPNVINGTDLVVFMNGDIIAYSDNYTLTKKMKTRDTSNKDSGLWDQTASGRLNVTGSCKGLMVYGSFELLNAAFIARNPVLLEFGPRVGDAVGGELDTARSYASGYFYIDTMDEGAGQEGNATYSMTFTHQTGFTHYPSTSGALRVRISHSDCTTHGGSQGFAAAFPSGGVAPYTYAWTGGATTQYITAKAAGTYTVTVTDATTGTHLTATATVIITEP